MTQHIVAIGNGVHDDPESIDVVQLVHGLTLGLHLPVDGVDITRVLHLGAGGCGVCERCAKQTGEPCRFPHLALASLEAYGVNVSQLAQAANMKYINGQNTVTYFGAVLFSTDGAQNE